MNTSFITLATAAVLLVALPATAADKAATTTQSKQVTTPSDQTSMAGMANFSMSGMSGDEKRNLAKSINRQSKQLSHGMSGMDATKMASEPAKPAK